MRVDLSKQFIEGRLDTPFFKDIPAMSDDELKCLFQFIRDVQQHKKLRGKNKPSWLDDDLNELSHTEIYQQNNIWHYHCGPYQPSKKYSPMSALKINLEGETSGPVIHYQKVAEDHIVIIAYSPEHQPFPKESDIPNPLTERTPEK